MALCLIPSSILTSQNSKLLASFQTEAYKPPKSSEAVDAVQVLATSSASKLRVEDNHGNQGAVALALLSNKVKALLTGVCVHRTLPSSSAIMPLDVVESRPLTTTLGGVLLWTQACTYTSS